MKKQKRTIYTILGMLSINPMSGYEIKQTIQGSTAFFWSESEGQIYPALTECVGAGFATCREDTSPGTQRTKKIYTISKKGKKELATWLVEEVKPTIVRNELLLKLFFGNNVDDSENIFHIKRYEKELKKSIKIYQGIRQHLLVEEKDSPDLTYWLITLDYGIKTEQAQLKWCQDSIKKLTTNEK